MLTPFIARRRRITFIFIPCTKTKFNYNQKKNTDMTDNIIHIDWMVLFYKWVLRNGWHRLVFLPWFSLTRSSPATKQGLFGSFDTQNWSGSCAGNKLFIGQPWRGSIILSKPFEARKLFSSSSVEPYTLDASMYAVSVLRCSRGVSLHMVFGIWGASLSSWKKVTPLSRKVASSEGTSMLMHSMFELLDSQFTLCVSASVKSWSMNCPQLIVRWVSLRESGFVRAALLPWTKRLTFLAFGNSSPLRALRSVEIPSPYAGGTRRLNGVRIDPKRGLSRLLQVPLISLNREFLSHLILSPSV